MFSRPSAACTEESSRESGRPAGEVTVPLMVFYRIAGDKILEHWMNADSLGLLQPIGSNCRPGLAAGTPARERAGNQCSCLIGCAVASVRLSSGQPLRFWKFPEE